MQNKSGDQLSPSTARPMMSDEPIRSDERSQINSRHLENPLLDGPNTPYSMGNMLGESDSTVI